jgi:hypothetical protein
LFKTGKAPAIGKFAALPGLNLLDDAIVALQEYAFGIRFLLQRQTLTVLIEAGVSLDEIVVTEAESGRNFCHLLG